AGSQGASGGSKAGGAGGVPYGVGAAGRLRLGGGGGGGANWNNGPSGAGGPGGGAVLIQAQQLEIEDGGLIAANGRSGDNGANTAGGGGAGAGGSVWLKARVLRLGALGVTAVGGVGGLQLTKASSYTTGPRSGGDGGVGDVALERELEVSGTSTPPARVATFSSVIGQRVSTRFSPPLDLSGVKKLVFHLKVDQPGLPARLELGEQDAGELGLDVTLSSAGTWADVEWDLSGVPSAALDAVSVLSVAARSASTPWTLKVDAVSAVR
ncbi:MAG: hypothetical protein K1X89_27485, partial [Myxococcaceae bacterium]|nr:hypothetical protein [Myxococcaceae bacterium]